MHYHQVDVATVQSQFESTAVVDVDTILQVPLLPTNHALTDEVIAKEIEKLPTVTQVTFRSSTEAFEIMRKESPRTIELLERNNISNPFPADLKIITNSVEDHQEVLNTLQSKYSDQLHPLFNNVINQHSNQLIKVNEENQRILSNVSENLLKFKTVTNQIIYWTILIFVIGGVLILMNAIQLAIFNRQNEIHVMKLVGATYSFIRLPYILEGIFYAIAAVMLSAILISIISSQISLSPLQSLDLNNYIAIIGGELLVTIVLGIISSTITVNRYLKKH